MIARDLNNNNEEEEKNDIGAEDFNQINIEYTGLKNT